MLKEGSLIKGWQLDSLRSKGTEWRKQVNKMMTFQSPWQRSAKFQVTRPYVHLHNRFKTTFYPKLSSFTLPKTTQHTLFIK